jgi:hypothetical protein
MHSIVFVGYVVGVLLILGIEVAVIALSLNRRRIAATLVLGTDVEMRNSVGYSLRPIVRGRIIGTIGGSLAVASMIALDVRLQYAIDWTLVAPTVLAAGMVGLTIGGAAAAVLQRPRAEGPRAARLSSTSLADYMPPLERGAPVVIVVVATAAFGFVLGAFASIARMQEGVPFILKVTPLVALAIVSLVLCTQMARRILRAPQPAVDEHDLRINDAIRSVTLRSLYSVPATLGAAAFIAVTIEAVYAVADTATVSFAPVGLLLAIPAVLLLTSGAALAQLILATRGRAASLYSRRLWPAESAVRG